jgi:integrase
MGRSGEGVFRTPNGRWLARYRDSSHKQRSRTFDTKRDAKNWKAEQERLVHLGNWTDPDARKQTLSMFVSSWRSQYEGRGLKASTREMYDEIYRNLVGPKWNDKPVGSITVDVVNEWTATFELSASRKHKMHIVLSQILDQAVLKKALAQNPLKLQKPTRPRTEAPVPLAYTQDEAKQLIEAMPDRFQLMTEFMCLTGLRIGEVISLRVKDLNFSEMVIHIRNATAVVNRALVEDTPKSRRVRTVPLTASLASKLLTHTKGKKDSDRVFPEENGAQLHPDRYRSVFKRVTREIGRPDMTPHNLRDTYASWSISAGIPITAISKALGHADASVTLRFYAAFFPEDYDRLRAILSEIKL